MVVYLQPRFYGTAAARFESAPIYNLDFLLALCHVPAIKRDVYVDDEGIVILEHREGDIPRVLIQAASGPVAKALLDAVDLDECQFIIQERWLSMLIAARWDISFEEMSDRRYTTDRNRFTGATEEAVLELDVKHEQMAANFTEDREDLAENPPLEDLLLWKGRGRNCRIFATIDGSSIRSYVLALPLSDDLKRIWQISYAFTPPEHRGRGYATAALIAATQAILRDGGIPLVTARGQIMKRACETQGYHCVGDRFWGAGRRRT